jgi:predicted RNA-binding Zn-ribbon protein involved in translation (DUF1610 family)
LSDPTGEPTPKVKMLCPSCGADDVLRDAFAFWDEETQKWELSDVYDNYACNTCGAEFREPIEEEIVDDGNHGGEQAPPEA